MLGELAKTFSERRYLGHLSKHSVFSLTKIDSITLDEKYKLLV